MINFVKKNHITKLNMCGNVHFIFLKKKRETNNPKKKQLKTN